MTLSPGTRLGPYEIIAPLGEGGMGEVYRALDPRLGRDVAIKTSKVAFDDRFQREARAIAALNHPNVCTLYDVGEDYLVMEYIDGQTLAERLHDGALEEAECLSIATGIATALEAAHEKGIVHRDLKPANIKVTAAGQVKVLDFGLAKALGQDPSFSSADDSKNSPTLTDSGGTRGFILGTAGYMAPEQTRGQPVDKRADIWAFGVVLWEMLTGRRLFEGDTSSDRLAAVLKAEPRWDDVPARLRPLLRRCLEKDPRKRLHDIADAWLWLNDVPVSQAVVARPVLDRSVRWLVTAALVTAVATAAWIWRGRQPVLPAESLHFGVVMPPGVTAGGTNAGAAIAPDGRVLAYNGVDRSQTRRLYVHSLTTGDSRVLPATEGAVELLWSPDSQSLAFRVGTKLKRVSLSGGPPDDLGEVPPDSVAGFWDDGFIVLGSGTGVWRYPESGGKGQQLTSVDAARGEILHGAPASLHDGKRFAYFIQSPDSNLRGLYLGSVDAPRERRLLVRTANKGVFSSDGPGKPGSLLYLRDDTLVAQSLDVDQGRLTGQPVIVAAPIRRATGMGTGGAAFWVAPTGLLLYGRPDGRDDTPLVWRSNDGNRLGDLVPPQGQFSSFFLSPDEKKITVDIRNAQGVHDVWIHDLTRGGWAKQTSDPANDFLAVWSPAGDRLVFGSSRSGVSQLYLTALGSTGEQLLTESPIRKFPLQWARDLVLFRGTDAAHPIGSLWAIAIDGDRKPYPVIQDQFGQFTGQISPDGKWIAYQSTKSSVNEIYLQPFPVGGRTTPVSTKGGRWPKWRRADGLELYYVSGNDAMMSVALTRSGENLVPATPKELFRTSIADDLTYTYDVTADGKRFLILERQTSEGRFEVVTNWRASIKR